MRDMLEVLKRAKQKRVFANQVEFENLLKEIQIADETLWLDWDDRAGEEWAKFSNKANGIVCMLSTSLRLAFIRHNYSTQRIKHILQDYEVIYTDDYGTDEWRIDTYELKCEIPEICWHASEEAVNTKCFSLDDFYFATI